MARSTIFLVAGTLLVLPLACDNRGPGNTAKKEGKQSGGDSGTSAGGTLWHEDLTLDKAREKAKAEDKTVLAYFYTLSCPACRILDQTVLNQKDIRELLHKQTVPVKVDMSDNMLLCLRYQVVAAPTLLFVRPDGAEIDRIVGAVPRDVFLSVAADFAAGRDRVAVARRDVVNAHYQLASALAARNRHRDARKEYLWTLNACMDSAELVDELGPYLIHDLLAIGEHDASAKKALQRHYQEAKDRLSAGSPNAADFGLISIFNRQQDQLADTVAIYDKIRGECSDEKLLKAWTEDAFDGLLEAERYEDIGAHADLEGMIDRLFAEAEDYAPQSDDYPTKQAFNTAEDSHKGQLAFRVCRLYQVLLALDRHEAAKRVAARLLKSAPGSRTLNGLAWSGYLTGRPTEEHMHQAREAYELASGEENAAVADTLARIMAARGQRDDALRFLEEVLAKTTYIRHRELLEQCRSAIQNTGPQE
ncbi:MAG: thioredoxin family protein [Phycisphaerae bacterium]|nr:thioredoxin family protein [Phycisphaerae bacterium]